MVYLKIWVEIQDAYSEGDVINSVEFQNFETYLERLETDDVIWDWGMSTE